MPTNVTARTNPVSAVQNHSEPGPMNAIPSVLMSVTPASSFLLTRWADYGRDGVGEQQDSTLVRQESRRLAAGSRVRTGPDGVNKRPKHMVAKRAQMSPDQGSGS